MKRPAQTKEDLTKWPVGGQPERTALTRTTVAYWRTKVQKVTCRGGFESPHYSARIGYQKRRERFPLNSPNREACAVKASKIFNYLLQNGWDATLEKYKPHTIKEEPVEALVQNTVGNLIQANQKYSSAREQTLQAYIQAFRRVVSGVMEQEYDTFQTRKECGTDAWRVQVDSVLLAELSPSRVQHWKQQFLKEHGKTASAKRKTTTTVNSLVRNSKALFSKKLLPLLEADVELPSPLPFEGVTMEKPPSPRYHSKIDAKAILERSHTELKNLNPESYKMLLLALVCGLRVSEIDYLLWDAFDFSTGLLIIEDTEYHQLKSEDSAGEIALSEDMKSIFKEYKKHASGDFVIESKGSVKRSKKTRSYRCKGIITTLKKWLREHGVHAQKPIHEMRKEIGSIIASEEGIFSASRYLRHSDIGMTSKIYADEKKRVIPSIGNNLLS